MGPSALESALALYRSPSLAAATRRRPLPKDVFEVIRIAAGDAEAIDAAAAHGAVDAAVLREASQLYLKQALFHPEADHYRVLGVSGDADPLQIIEHRRWLMKWLHPDRADDWDAVYAARVQQSWEQLRNPIRRAAYDDALAADEDWASRDAGQALRPVWTARALPAEDGGAASRRGWWVAVAVVALLAAGLAWSTWSNEASPSRTLADQPRSPDPGQQAPYVLEFVPPPDGIAPQLAAPDAAVTAMAPPDAREGAPPSPDLADIVPPPSVEPPSMPAPPDVALLATSRPAMTGAADSTPAVDAGPAPPGAPEVTAVQASVPEASTPAQPPLASEDLDALMAAFSAAYERGDIEALMTVFTSDARNRRGGRAAIREDYQRLFDSTRQRSLQWHSMQWQAGADDALGEGGFVASITPRRGASNTVHGRVRVDVVRHGSQVRIRELWHEDQAP